MAGCTQCDGTLRAEPRPAPTARRPPSARHGRSATTMIPEERPGTRPAARERGSPRPYMAPNL